MKWGPKTKNLSSKISPLMNEKMSKGQPMVEVFKANP
jgi:hypothetical protein